MNRIGQRIWERICDKDNIRLAIHNATKDAPDRPDNKAVLSRIEECVEEIRNMLVNESYVFSPFLHMVRYEPKERIIDYAQTYPDKILVNCVLNELKGEVIHKFIENTYSSIKTRGLHMCCEKIKKEVRKHPDGVYVLTDIKKYYLSILHELCKNELAKYIKDKKLLRFFSALIDNHKQGIAIGISLGSYIANLFLTIIDRWIYEEIRPLAYVRYMDDQLMIFKDKESAHKALEKLSKRAALQGLTLKNNARIAPVSSGIIMIGYKFFPKKTLLRKNIRERMKKRARKLAKRSITDAEWKQQMASYYGWCIHANCRHLMRVTFGDKYKLFESNIMKYERLKQKKEQNNFFALPKEARISIRDLKDKDIVILEVMSVNLYGEDKTAVKFCFPDKEDDLHLFLTRSDTIRDKLEQDKEFFPCVVTLREKQTANGGKKYYTYE